MHKILPKILAVITQCDRVLVQAGMDFEWSHLWTANLFFAFEVVFGRRFGIVRQTSASYDGKWQFAHTWRAAIVLAECSVRSFRLAPMKIHIPIFMTPQGIPILASPYLFAIAREADGTFGNNSAGANISFNITTVATNTQVVVGAIQNDVSATSVTCTVGGNAATKVDNAVAPSLTHNVFMFIKAVTTAQLYAVALSGTSTNQLEGVAVSYSGAPGGMDAEKTDTDDNTTYPRTTSLQTIADNCWTVMALYQEATIVTAGTGSSIVTGAVTANQMTLMDSNSSITPAQSYSMSWSGTNGDDLSLVMMSLSPTAATPATIIPAAIIMFN